MKFDKFPYLEGKHAFLSPSNVSRFNYDEDKLLKTYGNIQNVELGTRMHSIAEQIINFNYENQDNQIILSDNGSTFNMFVNDATNFRMQSEVPLYYSELCFGHADAITFVNNHLLIFDLKTGEGKTHIEQLENYAALFCLQYGNRLGFKPIDISIQLRIYQKNEIQKEEPDANVIVDRMNYIVWADQTLKEHIIEKGLF